MSTLQNSWPFASARRLAVDSSLLWLAGAIALSFLLRLPFLTVPLISDEGGYAYAADRWLNGPDALYRDLMFDRPQGIFLIYGLIQHTLGTDVVAIRLGAWLASVVTMVFVWSIARQSFGRREAQLSVVLFALISGAPGLEGFTANAEVFMVLPSTICIWLLLRAGTRRWPTHLLVGAGVCAGAAILIKQSGIVMLPVAVAWVGLSNLPSLRMAIRRGAWVTLGFVAAVIPSIVHGWSVGWDAYMTGIAGRVGANSGTTVTPLHQAYAISWMIGRTWPLFAATGLILYAGWKQKRQAGTSFHHSFAQSVIRFFSPTKGTEATTLLRLWLVGSAIGIAIGGNWYVHYLTQLVAPLSIWLAGKLTKRESPVSQRARREIVILIVAVLLIPYSVVVTTRADANTIGQNVFNRTTYAPQASIAAYLQSHSPADASIYVAFYQTSFYYLADREAASKNLYFWQLTSPEAQAELVAMVESPDRPLYIVDLPQSASFFEDDGERFWRGISEHYHVETTIDGIDLYRANSDT